MVDTAKEQNKESPTAFFFDIVMLWGTLMLVRYWISTQVSVNLSSTSA